jgi:Flp pilus assembly protein TadD
LSSLLDVLHKRPARASALAADETSGPTPGMALPSRMPDDATLELGLAPDFDHAAGAATTRVPPPAPATAGGETTVEWPPAVAPAAESGATTQMRRWTDPGAVDAAPTPAPAASPRRRARSRMPFTLTVLALLLAAVGFAAWQLSAPSEDGFLAEPGPAPSAPVVATAPDPEGEAPPPPLTPRSIVDETAGEGDGAVSGDELPWYDQPALPQGLDTQPAPLIVITRGSVRNPSFAKLRDAWEALRTGDLGRSEPLYREVLAVEPGNVDALLGLAALAMRGGRPGEARDLYRSVQRLDPRNATALAALSALLDGARPVTGESQLKALLREQPGAAALHFALGLRYVGDGRWPDAQAAFFEAVRYDPTNADYAFNLAVSLDRLGQARAAASYYQRAIDLAAGSEQFDVATARARLTTLRSGQG